MQTKESFIGRHFGIRFMNEASQWTSGTCADFHNPLQDGVSILAIRSQVVSESTRYESK